MKKGIGASSGIAIGKALVVHDAQLIIEKAEITDCDLEIERFSKSIEASKEELKDIKEKAVLELGEADAAIFDAHLMVLQDPELSNEVTRRIQSKKLKAEYIFKEVSAEFITMFESMDNDYMRERAADIRDVSGRVLGHLLGQIKIDLSKISEEVILVKRDLAPSDTATMNKKNVLGFLTDIGGKTSHSAIMARTLGIPAVVGLDNVTQYVEDGMLLLVNGDTGEVIVNPTNEKILEYKELQAQYKRQQENLKSFIGKATQTLDGIEVELAANIGDPEDLENVIKQDAQAIGLFRTEFLYMNRANLPTEEEQFISYKKVAQTMKEKPIVIRTLDIGGDKEVPYLDLKKEENPFLGYRAIRMCLCKPFKEKLGTYETTCDRCAICKTDVFITQLRAILRASHYGNIKIMFPMISSLEELIEAKNLLNHVKQQLQDENIRYNVDIEVGMMIEVPSAAITSDIFAKHVDFFSIGTNDLIQYTCAVDRMNQKINHLYNPYNPAIFRLIKDVIKNGHNENIWVGMCGGMAEDPLAIPILIGLGLDEFSMSANGILESRKQILQLKQSECKEYAQAVLGMSCADEIQAYLESLQA